jgi:hypothetical protein
VRESDRVGAINKMLVSWVIYTSDEGITSCHAGVNYQYFYLVVFVFTRDRYMGHFNFKLS